MRVGDFIFDYVTLLHCKCHKVNVKKESSYIDSTDWIKSNNKPY